MLCLSTIAPFIMSMPIRLAAKRASAAFKPAVQTQRNLNFAAATAKASHLPEEVKEEFIVSYLPDFTLTAAKTNRVTASSQPAKPRPSV